VEFALYGAPGELPELPHLQAAAGDALCQVVTERVPDDWFDGWKRFHRPIRVGKLVLRPPWEPAADAGGLLDVVIDPGQAFGTGSHHTTRLCLELLGELAPRGCFLDLGCGSGVLAVAAAKLGWSPVCAADHEVAAVEAARATARANGVDVAVSRLDLRRDPVPAADVVAANLLRPLLLELADALPRPPRALVASGLLAGEADEVAAAFAGRGLRERSRRHGGEWAALLLGGD
jgi:ribosomal protein L11 methyltransferase